VRRIQTPLLLMHGEKDQRVGTTQTQMLFRALKVLNKPVELAVYPGADHDLSRSGPPLQRIDRLLRMLEFFERYVGR
jgi:dipeptidyl aminopeptidase/acylaminoacyl peptidase